jgi:membrane protein YdbS with pleckstrin-like domain
MAQTYSFLSRKDIEFTNDKITAIVFKENFIDRWLNTCSIIFWSIGSSEDIIFSNIKKSEGLYENILAKVGIRPQKAPYEIRSRFSFVRMLKANFYICISIALVLIGLTIAAIFSSPFFIIAIILSVLLIILITIYKTVFYRKSVLQVFEDYVYFRKGIFFRTYYYALYDNIKDISVLKHPFSDHGSIKFNIAGEHVQQQQKRQGIRQSGQQRYQGTISNSFKIVYVDKISNKDEMFDLIFYKRPRAPEIAQMEQSIEGIRSAEFISAKPDLANTLAVYLIFSLFIWPLILFLPLVIMSVRARSYSIEQFRVVARSGILYKKQISVIFKKIDHINQSQGMLNKIFKNGNITINTAGSSKAELMVFNIPNYDEFYGKLKENY